MFDTISFHDTTNSLTFGDTNSIDLFVLFENLVDFNFFFEEVFSEFDLIFDGSSVNLDFHNVVLLLS